MPPQHDGQVWYTETLSLLERLQDGGRLDFIANEVEKRVREAHAERGWKRRPRILPKQVLGEALHRGYVSEEEARNHWHWYQKEQARKEKLERDILPAFRGEILKRDGRRCQYCEAFGTTLDHLIPISKGGLSVRLNLLTACEPCNRAKYVSTLPEETLIVIRFFLKRERTVEHGYPYMMELIRQFFQQLEQKSPLERVRIRSIVGIKRSKIVLDERRKAHR